LRDDAKRSAIIRGAIIGACMTQKAAEGSHLGIVVNNPAIMRRINVKRGTNSLNIAFSHPHHQGWTNRHDR
jgi:hypothetical protein